MKKTSLFLGIVISVLLLQSITPFEVHADVATTTLATTTLDQSPVVSISATPTSGASPLEVHFSTAGTYDPNGYPLTYLWGFGDGVLSTEQNPVHIYNVADEYYPTVIVSNGKTASTTKSIHVTVSKPVSLASPTHLKTVVNTDNLITGEEMSFSSTIANSGAPSPILVDYEIYNSQGVKVGQKFFDNISIPTDLAEDFNFTWTPDTMGDYYLSVGLFQKNWAGVYEWTNKDITFSVAQAPLKVSKGPFYPRLNVLSVNSVNHPNNIMEGDTVYIGTMVENLGDAGTGLIDIELYKDGVKIAQKFYDNADFPEDIVKPFTLPWIAGTPGTYTVSIGLFKPNWAGLYSWIDQTSSFNNATFTVGAYIPPVPPSFVNIYYTGFENGWQDWSWDTENSISSVIKATFKSPWAGLFFHNEKGLDTTGKNALQFSVMRYTPDQDPHLQVLVYGADGTVIGRKSLDELGGLSKTNWTDFTVPLVDLNAANKVITGIAFQGTDGKIQDPFFVMRVKIQ